MPSKTPTSNLKNGFLSRETDSPDWKRLRIENHFEEEFFPKRINGLNYFPLRQILFMLV